MKTKKKFFLKAAGISPVKGAGISLALVMMFAMAFAACDNGTSSSRNDNPSVSGPTDLGTGPTAESWADVEDYLKSSAPEHKTIYIRTIMTVTEGLVGAPHEVVVGSGKTLVITGERTLTGTTASAGDAEEGTAKQVLSPTGVPRLYIPKRARLTVASGGTLVLGGPRAETYGGIVEVEKGGALHIAEGATLAVNMSSRVWVNGENYDNDAGYVALNIESRSKLAIIGDFVTGDKIIDTNYDERTLIGITLREAPVAVGAALVYNTFPIPSEEEKNLKRSLERETEIATAKSPIKVADEPADVITLLATASLNGTERLVYSGAGALVGNGGTNNDTLDIATSATIPPTLIIQKAVTQNSSVKIKGAAVLMEGASITVTRNTDGTLATLSLDASSKLSVQNGASIAVANGGTLDLSAATTAATTSTPADFTLYGEITAAANGAIILPATYDNAIDWGTAATGIGKITLAANSTAKLGPSATNAYIGPVVTTPATVADYTWDATDTISSTVTLTKDTLTLKGNLSVTGTSVSLAKTAIIESGVLTVANAAKLTPATKVGKLTVATSAGKVLVAKGGTLDFTGLNTATDDTGAVTLYGNIEVAGGGTINLPAPATTGTEKFTVVQVNYAGGGVIKLNATSNATMISNATSASANYVGPATNSPAPLWQWTGDPNDTSYVELKAAGEMALTGKLTSAAANNEIATKATIKSGSTLTIASGSTVTMYKTGKLDVNANATVKLEGALDFASNQDEPDTEKKETASLIVYGNIDVAASNAALRVLDLHSKQIEWGTAGKITFSKGSKFFLGSGAGSKTYIGKESGTAGFFTWPESPANAVASITLTNGVMTLAGDITANAVSTVNPWIYDAAVVSTGTLTIADSATLVLGKGATITVEDGATLKAGVTVDTGAGTLALEKTTSKLVLEPGGKLDFTKVSTIVGDATDNKEADVTVTVTNANGVVSKAIMSTPPTATTEFTVSAVNNSGSVLTPFTVTLGKFSFSSVANLPVDVEGVGTGSAAGKLIAGKAGTLADGLTQTLATYITFAGTVVPGAN